jgi:hypothetical protein
MDKKEYLDLLIDWAHNKNYSVDFKKNGYDSVCDVSKTIEINSSLPIRTQVIRLLHECGHVLIFENGSHFKFNEKTHYSPKSTNCKIFTIIEEIEAWKRGKELAIRLHIPIIDEVWDKAMVSALNKYVKWAAKKEE